MPKQFKISAVFTFGLAILFFVFFDKSKHIPALADVNVFNVDPYDAVGSFGMMFALLTALLALLRTFRPYENNEIIATQKNLIVRAEAITVLSVAVTMAANVIALIRFSSVWIHSSAGQMLAALVVAMIFVTAFIGWIIFRNVNLPSKHGSWRNAWMICIASIIILAVYPSAWDEGIIGGIGTAVLGMVILFFAVWALALAIFPQTDFSFEDLLDDLSAIYRWLKARAVFAVGLLNWFEKTAARSEVQAVTRWSNPRKHKWNLAILVGFAIGFSLALAEVIIEGASPNLGKSVLVMSIFVGVGGVGVIFGYALFAKLLGIFRKD